MEQEQESRLVSTAVRMCIDEITEQGHRPSMYQNLEPISVFVGPRKASFIVHKKLLSKSTLLAAHLDRHKDIELPAEEVEVFDLFVAWLYSQRVAIEEPAQPSMEEGDKTGWQKASRDFGVLLVKLFLFAQRHSIVRLKNDVVDRMKVSSRTFWNPEIAMAYDNLPPGSCLREFMLDTAIDGAAGEWLQHPASAAFLLKHHEVAVDLLLGVGRRLQSLHPRSEKAYDSGECGYHEHSSPDTPGRRLECWFLEHPPSN